MQTNLDVVKQQVSQMSVSDFADLLYRGCSVCLYHIEGKCNSFTDKQSHGWNCRKGIEAWLSKIA